LYFSTIGGFFLTARPKPVHITWADRTESPECIPAFAGTHAMNNRG